MNRVLKCFVTPTLTYTAQVDESMLHICFESLHIIEYICWNWIAKTASDSRFKMLCTLTLTYTAQVDESVLHINFDTHHIIEYICWSCFVSTATDTCFNMVCYADFSIYRSSRRKPVAYLFLISTHYWVYLLKLNCKDC